MTCLFVGKVYLVSLIWRYKTRTQENGNGQTCWHIKNYGYNYVNEMFICKNVLGRTYVCNWFWNADINFTENCMFIFFGF